jgi:ribonuclease HI
MIAPKRHELKYAIRFGFKTTNNEAEYEVVVAGLAMAQEFGAENVGMRSNSKVIVGYIQGEYKAKEERMKKYLSKVRELITQFKSFTIKKVLHE